MGALIGIGAAIIAAVSSVVVVVASVIASIVLSIGSIIYTIGAGFYGITVGFIVGALEGISIIGPATATNILVNLGVANGIGTTVYAYAGAAIETVLSAVKTFTTAIHLKTLLQVHQLAYFASSSYRSSIQNLYKEIGKYGDAIKTGSGFVLLAMQNSRNIVLDASTMLGRPYDLGQVAWLGELDGWLTTLNKAGDKYYKNPELFLLDLEEALIKPSMETKSKAMQFVYSTLENAASIIDASVKNIDKLAGDIVKLANDLPKQLKGEWVKDINKVDADWKNFRDKSYYPVVKDFDKLLNSHYTTLVDHKDKLQTLAQRLLYPGDYINELNSKSDEVRRSQVAKINNVIFQNIDQAVKSDTQTDNTIQTGLSSINDALSTEIEKPSWEYKEQEGAVFDAGQQSTNIPTWYQGDY